MPVPTMLPPTVAEIRAQLQGLSDPTVAEHSKRFFRSAPGEYGEGDTFIGVRVPALRRVFKQHRSVSLHDTELLLKHYKDMPRTMLRYAIEKLPETTRQRFLTGKV
jgi:hypothetical protein